MTARAFYDLSASLRRADGTPLPVGDRVAFVLHLLVSIAQARLERAVEAGDPATAATERALLTAWQGVQATFERELADGGVREVAAARAFRALNAYDAIVATPTHQSP